MTAIEKDIPYELVPIAYGGAEHQAINPFARIPVLEHEGRTIAETLAISGYLDEAFPGPSLQPTDLGERTRMRTWMGVCADYVYREVVRGLPRREPPSAAQLEAAAAVLAKVEQMIHDGPFLLGARLTLADVYLAPQASNAREKAPELLVALPRLNEWLAAIESRPSFSRTAYDPASL
jgi:glutathione S-transferase